jgi:hypothetical protein
MVYDLLTQSPFGDEQSKKAGDYGRWYPCSVGLVGQGQDEHFITDVVCV